jgi:hypothetical protein
MLHKRRVVLLKLTNPSTKMLFYGDKMPISVAALRRGSLAGIAGSNPAEDVDLCLL